MLLLLIVFSAFAVAASTKAVLPPLERIRPDFGFIEGTQAGKSDYPPIVSLAYYFTEQEVESQLNISVKGDNFDHFCGGTIVHSQWVLTAAHCLQDEVKTDGGFENIRVRVGFVDLSMGKPLEPGEENFQVEEIVLHPGFDTKFRFADDLALVKIRGRFNGRVATVETSDQDLKGEATAFGWGQTDTNIAALESLRLTRATDGICQGDWERKIMEPMEDAGELKKQLICFGAKARRGGCYADSGGPLVFGPKKALIGVASFLYDPCGEFSYYQRVNRQVPWIEKTIGANVKAGSAAAQALGPYLFSLMIFLILALNANIDLTP